MYTSRLTPEQIKTLFSFCRKHAVNQYDLQMELVDHIASSIEEQWETKHEISFQEALNNTFVKFGLLGFSKIKDRKKKELRRKYNRLLFQYLLDYYRWPKVLLASTLSILLFILFRLTNNVPLVTISLSGVIFIFPIFYNGYLFDKLFNLKIQPGKSFLILDCLKNRQKMLSIAFQLSWVISMIIHKLNYNYISHPEIEFVFAFFLTGYILLLYLYFFIVPQKIKKHFTEQFPQFVKL